jgi:hypothetical protein
LLLPVVRVVVVMLAVAVVQAALELELDCR